jgi:hypothetical protein
MNSLYIGGKKQHGNNPYIVRECFGKKHAAQQAERYGRCFKPD